MLLCTRTSLKINYLAQILEKTYALVISSTSSILDCPQFLIFHNRFNTECVHSTNTAAQQFSQTRSRCLTKGSDQIIAIDVPQFFVFHPFSLSHPCVT